MALQVPLETDLFPLLSVLQTDLYSGYQHCPGTTQSFKKGQESQLLRQTLPAIHFLSSLPCSQLIHPRLDATDPFTGKRDILHQYIRMYLIFLYLGVPDIIYLD